MKKFKTISEDVEAEIEEKKSRFIANIYYVEKAKEAEEEIKKIKKKHFDARHHCYSYRIMEEDGLKEKQSDDGEPSGTAGAPMLNILAKNELCNILVIVTRYFGGTLLGTGGLVRAYSDATIEALKKAEIVVQELGEEIEITIPYSDLEKLKYYCRKNGIEITDIVYDENIICKIEINSQEKAKLFSENQQDIKILENCVVREKYIRVKIDK